MLQRIIDIVACTAFIDPKNLSAMTTLERDLEMDKVDRMALQIQLEDGLHIAIDTQKMCQFETIKDIEEYAISRRRIRQMI